MKLQRTQFIAVAELTAQEIIRQPIVLIIATSCVVFISLMPIIISHTMGESQKMVQDSALAILFMSGMLLGAYSAASTLRKEIERNTVASVLSKPINRSLFFIAKFAGIAIILFWYSLTLTITTLMACRMAHDPFHVDWWAGIPLLVTPVIAYILAAVHNYFTSRAFTSSAFTWLFVSLVVSFVIVGCINAQGEFSLFRNAYAWDITTVAFLIFLALLILASMALTLSTHLPFLPAASICIFLLMIGLMSDYLFGRLATTNLWACAAYCIIPNWQHFWLADALSYNRMIPFSYVAILSVYSVCYMFIVLTLGALALKRTDV